MSTTEDGREAETLVAKYLENNKHKIISKNWRTRWCEIDVVSAKKKCVYFTEVKFRSSNDWGGGLEYITPKKLKQMKFAAELWLNENNWKNDVILQAAEVDKTGKIYLTEV
ncbi:MAG: YraN family protein [Candidatus Saccharibacteria bacterium]|nr:YraN family protein [Candidatus Saccharibacteria bacterium]